MTAPAADVPMPSSGSDAPDLVAATPVSSPSDAGGPGPLLPIGLATLAAAGLLGMADYQRVRRQPLPAPPAAGR